MRGNKSPAPPVLTAPRGGVLNPQWNKKIIVIAGMIVTGIIYAYCISGAAENVALTGILTKNTSYKNIGMNRPNQI
jgi:hypothetical protein